MALWEGTGGFQQIDSEKSIQNEEEFHPVDFIEKEKLVLVIFELLSIFSSFQDIFLC